MRQARATRISLLLGLLALLAAQPVRQAHAQGLAGRGPARHAGSKQLLATSAPYLAPPRSTPPPYGMPEAAECPSQELETCAWCGLKLKRFDKPLGRLADWVKASASLKALSLAMDSSTSSLQAVYVCFMLDLHKPTTVMSPCWDPC